MMMLVMNDRRSHYETLLPTVEVCMNVGVKCTTLNTVYRVGHCRHAVEGLVSILQNLQSHHHPPGDSNTSFLMELECCKGDDASQRGDGKFDPLPRPNPTTDRHQILHA